MDSQAKVGRNLTTGNWITIIAGCVFIVSLFLDWASAGGFMSTTGIGFIVTLKSYASGLYEPFFLALLAAIGCSLLSIPVVKKRGKGNIIPITRIVLAVLGLLPFGLLPSELRTWMPEGQLELGGWLAILSAFGLLIGAVLSFRED